MYKVKIRNNKTGEVRVYEDECEWHENSVWFWTKGNFGCDCNRHLLFHRAVGDESDYDVECDDGKNRKYSAIDAVLESGEVVVLDGE
jgi:hypothetical protein